MKRSVRQDITHHRPGKNVTVLTKSGHILSPCEVAEHLKARFNTAQFVEEHQNSTIREVVVQWTPTAEIKRPPVEFKYDSMPGLALLVVNVPACSSLVAVPRPA